MTHFSLRIPTPKRNSIWEESLTTLRNHYHHRRHPHHDLHPRVLHRFEHPRLVLHFSHIRNYTDI